jgi:hypothetical protein
VLASHMAINEPGDLIEIALFCDNCLIRKGNRARDAGLACVDQVCAHGSVNCTAISVREELSPC